MNILIIGGTRFLGRHLVEHALKRGHTLTLFNRGKSNADLFPQVETILGDRETDLIKLTNRKWDAVIDTCGYFPRIVRLSAQALKNQADAYVFISSISAYANFSQVGITEESDLATMPDESLEEITGESYGPLKVLCEQAAQAEFGSRASIIRPGLIVGPHDPTDRFTYWPVRVARGGDVLAPEKPEVPVQIIDVRDLAEFILYQIENKASGVFNATGPNYALTFGKMLEICQETSKSDATFHWASPEFLAAHNVAAWSDMPVWVPDTEEDAGFSKVNISKALKAGLTFRTLTETVQDTLAWTSTRPTDHVWKAGLSQAREEELMQALNVS